MTTAKTNENCNLKSIQTEKIFTKKRKKPADKLIKGAFILSLGSILTKVLGAFYRIPLTKVLGSEGLGIYQTVFPIYCILLTFSSTGAPTSIAKLIANGYDSKTVLKKSLSLFLPIGVLGSLTMLFLCKVIANLQANPSAYLSYIALSPSVAIVSVISCFRGYFQGKLNMFPTAISQVVEQAIKLIFGLSLCLYFGETPSQKGCLACLAVTISEVVSLLYLLTRYKRGKFQENNTADIRIKQLIATLLPILLTSIALPISKSLDSFTVINFLIKYTPFATNYYGIYTGSVESVASVPVAICYSIATVVLPTVAKANTLGDFNLVKKIVVKAIALTLIISSVLGLVLFIFSPLITRILFKSLSQEERLLTSKLISLSFFTVIGLSLTQTLTACLIALNKPFVPCIFLSVGVFVKLILQIFLLKNPKINIFGCLYSDIACYFVAVFLILLYIKYITFKNRRLKTIKRE